MTTTVVLRCVIQHIESLPSLSAAVLRGGIVEIREAISASASEVMRREGDLKGAEQSPLTDFIGSYFREKGRTNREAERELAEAIAAICPQAEKPGGPHAWNNSGRVFCAKCGAYRGDVIDKALA